MPISGPPRPAWRRHHRERYRSRPTRTAISRLPQRGSRFASATVPPVRQRRGGWLSGWPNSGGLFEPARTWPARSYAPRRWPAPATPQPTGTVPCPTPHAARVLLLTVPRVGSYRAPSQSVQEPVADARAEPPGPLPGSKPVSSYIDVMADSNSIKFPGVVNIASHGGAFTHSGCLQTTAANRPVCCGFRPLCPRREQCTGPPDRRAQASGWPPLSRCAKVDHFYNGWSATRDTATGCQCAICAAWPALRGRGRFLRQPLPAGRRRGPGETTRAAQRRSFPSPAQASPRPRGWPLGGVNGRCRWQGCRRHRQRSFTAPPPS